MAAKRIPIPPKEELDEIFEYRDGELYWKKPTGTLDGGGYMQTGIKGKYCKNHRIIFMMHHGYVPDFIDHIDGNPLNNRIENLRAVTESQNQYNRSFQRNNKTGIKGVSWDKSQKRWKARIGIDGKDILLGHFNNINDAENAVKEARIKYHGEFANFGVKQ